MKKQAAKSDRSRRPAALWGSEFSGQSSNCNCNCNNNWETDVDLGRYRPARQLETRCTCNTVAGASNVGFLRIDIRHFVFLCSQYLRL